MIVPASNPHRPDRTAWSVVCNGCGVCAPAGTCGEWLISDDELDVHFCPPCWRLLSAALITAALGP